MEEEGRLAYRVRTAQVADAAALRPAIGSTLAHPDNQGRRESYSGAAGRGDLLILERYDRSAHDWQVAGFVECHMRVDDNLSIRDVGTTGDEPQTGVVRYLLDQAFNSYRPVEAQVKIRRDATRWLEIFQAIPGFHLEGEEYRRPHYWTIWRWDRQRAREAEQPQRPASQSQRLRQRPPAPPPASANPSFPRGPRPGGAGSGPGPAQRGPGGPAGGPSSRDSGSGNPAQRGPRPAGPGGPRPAGPGGPRPAGPGGPRPAGPGGPRPAGANRPRPASPNSPRPAGADGQAQRGPRRPTRPANPR